MNDSTILHLSDLHINQEGERLSLLMENLLIDIKQEMERKVQRAKRKIKWHKDMEFLAFAIGFVVLCIVILLLIWLVL